MERRMNSPAVLRRVPDSPLFSAQSLATEADFRQDLAALRDELRIEVNEVRELTVTFLEQRTVQVEKQIARLERRVAEVSGHVTGLSTEMQAQIRQNKMLESHLGEAKRQSNEGVRSKCMELELRLQKASNAALSSIEDVVAKHDQRLEELEAGIGDSFKHASRDVQPAPSVEARLTTLGAGQPDTGSCGVDVELIESRLQELEKTKVRVDGSELQALSDTMKKVLVAVDEQGAADIEMRAELAGFRELLGRRTDGVEAHARSLSLAQEGHSEEVPEAQLRERLHQATLQAQYWMSKASEYKQKQERCDQQLDDCERRVAALESTEKSLEKQAAAERKRLEDALQEVTLEKHRYLQIGDFDSAQEAQEREKACMAELEGLPPVSSASKTDAKTCFLENVFDAARNDPEQLKNLVDSEQLKQLMLQKAAGLDGQAKLLEKNLRSFPQAGGGIRPTSADMQLDAPPPTAVVTEVSAALPEVHSAFAPNVTIGRAIEEPPAQVSHTSVEDFKQMQAEIRSALQCCSKMEEHFRALRNESSQDNWKTLSQVRSYVDKLNNKAVDLGDKASCLETQVTSLEQDHERILQMSNSQQRIQAEAIGHAQSAQAPAGNVFDAPVASHSAYGAAEFAPVFGRATEAHCAPTASAFDFEEAERKLKQVRHEADKFKRKIEALEPHRASATAKKKVDYLKLVNHTEKIVETEAQKLRLRVKRLGNTSRGTDSGAEGGNCIASNMESSDFSNLHPQAEEADVACRLQSFERALDQLANRLDGVLDSMKEGTYFAAGHATHLTDKVVSLETRVEAMREESGGRCKQLAEDLSLLTITVAQIQKSVDDPEFTVTDSRHFYIGT